MKKLLAILLLAAIVFCPSVSAEAPKETSRQAQWKKVDEAIKKGLPKTAIEHLEPIIAGALKDKAYGEAIKAIGRKIALEGNIQGNKPEEKITRMEAEIAKAPKEMVPIMDAILANWYWHYFQQNRWRFLRRTQTAEPPGKDFTTWDLKRILAEIDKQFTKALAAEKTLKATPVAKYDDLLTKGTVPDNYRPTMYDFLAHNALQFYASGTQAGAKAEDTFELMADGPIFAPADEFVKWEPETTDEQSLTLKAIRLYQNLLKFHAGDKDKTALIDADLARLVFGKNKAFGEDKNKLFKATMKRFTDKWGDSPIAAQALFQWASVLRGEGDLVEARKLAKRGFGAFPNSAGGASCFNLIQQIEAKSSNITTERVWNDPLPTIEVRYRNLTKVYFRAVPYDWEQLIKRRHRPEYLDQKERQVLLAKKPALEWSADLPATKDYHERVEELPAPKNLKPGFYYLVSSHEPKFGDKNNQVKFTPLWVSDLALVMRTRHGTGVIEGFVLEANSGEPIPGAEIRSWVRTSRGGRVAGPSTKTDKDGLFKLSPKQNQGYAILAEHRGQQLATMRDYYDYRRDYTIRPHERTVFFTDRSLYRPGQTIRYKGICIRVDQQKDDYHVLGARDLTVVFRDRNGKEIEKRKHRTNDYGSFAGSFTAPRDRLMGRMSIRVEGQPNGATQFNVEEYKRPKFQVTLDKPETAPKLGDKVSLKGKALAYTGAAINGAKVRYRVVRQVRYPIWWGWYCWWRQPQTSSQEIAHGRAVTKPDGSFTIEFLARPDPSVPEKDEPTFHYTVYADVTDTTGETRSGQTLVRVGYTALQASLSAASWLTDEKPVEISIATQTLDGVGQRAEGSLKIYKLKEPNKVYRPRLSGRRYYGRPGAKDKEPKPDPANPVSWPLGEVVFERGFTTDAEGNVSYSFKLGAGMYRAMLETQDRFGKKVTARLPLRVLDPDAKKLAIRIAQLFDAETWTIEPGEKFTALWGSGYDKARAYVEVEHRRKVIQSYWTKPGQTQASITQAVTEPMRGGFTVRVTMVRENRAFLHSRKVNVPWTNKNLTVKWEHFVSKLQPAQKETWTAVITGPDAKKAVAEMVATLYDASLDAYKPHHWMQRFNVFRQDYSNLSSQFENALRQLQHLQGNWPVASKHVQWTYRSFPHDIIANFWGYQYFGRGGRPGMALKSGARRSVAAAGAPAMEMAMDAAAAPPGAPTNGGNRLAAKRKMSAFGGAAKENARNGGGQQAPQAKGPDLTKVAARKNLNETAFFFPHLISEKNGEVKLEFTMPEALTEWNFFGFAHDKQLRSGYLQDKAVTSKDIMVQPNAPRFLREGDVLEFTVKVSNQSAARQTGKVRLTLADARTAKSVDAQLGNTATDLSFDIPSKESKSYSWKLTVPDGMGFLSYKAIGSTGKLSDGEEGYLPVLSRRIFVTESLPLPIRGPATKKFVFQKLLDSGKSKTLKQENVVVQMVSNPSWYAVMALPYLMEYPHQCAEQIFNRLYANSLARHIANSDPKIRRVFDQWKGTPALDSPMEKNQDLKAVMLEETPWLRQAKKESQARRDVGILFDDNRLNSETRRALNQLTQMQKPDGSWPWFPGGRGNWYITCYITTGFGRMRHLGVDIKVDPAVRSLNYLDSWIDRRYRDILKHGDKDANHMSPSIAFYLYGRSFFLKDKPVAKKHKEAVDYFLAQAKKYWLKVANRQSQAHMAIALKRFGDKPAAQGIMRSIKERSVSNEELGMFWRDLELSWWWYRAPIETQAMMIEAFDEVMGDAKAVEECKVWLLKQKQTQDWKTTKATADAVYALLLRGTDLLASDELVEVSLAGKLIKPEKVEAGTGFYEQRFTGPEIKPQMGEITVKKIDKGVAWGAVHWQYLEDMSKVTPYEGTPLTLKKALYTKVNTKTGPVLKPVAGPLAVGDELVVRIVLRVDRDMEYVHLKDQRGSGTEPVNVLSRYKYQDGLAYYESTRDVASHFFIDYLPKGTYVFEYSTRVVHRGQYQTGMAQIQCMYAPEFNSHSESFNLVVK